MPPDTFTHLLTQPLESLAGHCGKLRKGQALGKVAPVAALHRLRHLCANCVPVMFLAPAQAGVGRISLADTAFGERVCLCPYPWTR